ncbi:MAG: outer membrane beta-barrel protein [candidate division Zixibacteria bacterium]|nr:outer membrane beta-barrel protein [candidate division Zixibacteria bacterium]
MKTLITTMALIACLTIPAFAITGLGIGVHVGQTTGYDNGNLDTKIQEISDALEQIIGPEAAIETPEFKEKLTNIGAHIKFGTLPVIDFIGFFDYSWKKKELTSNVDLRVSNLTYGVTAVKKFGVALFKPYAGAGIAFHKVVYNIESEYESLLLLLPNDETKMGYHFVGGVELDFPLFPLAPYAEGKYNIITTSDKSTKYFLLSVGLTMNF